MKKESKAKSMKKMDMDKMDKGMGKKMSKKSPKRMKDCK